MHFYEGYLIIKDRLDHAYMLMLRIDKVINHIEGIGPKSMEKQRDFKWV